MQRRTAEVAIGASAIRNTGASGVVGAARRALSEIDLSRFGAAPDREGFSRELDRVTKRVQAKLPTPADRWGSARKAVNLFLRDVLYNTYLAAEYGFSRLEPWLELPLDSYTASALRNRDGGADLPRWPGVGRIEADVYSKYQAAAEAIADECGISRVHLDIYWWREA